MKESLTKLRKEAFPDFWNKFVGAVKNIFDRSHEIRDDNPAEHCDYHKIVGCPDVDRSPCFFPECSALEEFKAKF